MAKNLPDFGININGVYWRGYFEKAILSSENVKGVTDNLTKRIFIKNNFIHDIKVISHEIAHAFAYEYLLNDITKIEAKTVKQLNKKVNDLNENFAKKVGSIVQEILHKSCEIAGRDIKINYEYK